MSAPPVLIHVQHLLGVGHLRRAAALARALAAEGFAVTLLSGGPPDPALALGAARLIQLEPLRAADASFSGLIDAAGRAPDEALKARRRAQVLDTFNAVRPFVLITELFPFGRRQLRFELIPLIEAARGARPRPLVLASVRDILVEKRQPERLAEMAALARAHYDRVVVHGDARLVPFGASFPLADEIADLLHYSGYVASDAGIEAPPGVGAEEIVVSAGGGAVGRHLIETARAAHRLIGAPGRRHRWRVLAGGAFTPAELARLAAETGDGLVIEPTRADFPSLLRRAALSVSQAGYNTVTDILSAGVRSILVPFAAGQETEQTLRARALQAHGRALVLDENALTPEQLAGAIARALELPPPGPSPFALDGAAATVRLIRGLLAP